MRHCIELNRYRRNTRHKGVEFEITLTTCAGIRRNSRSHKTTIDDTEVWFENKRTTASNNSERIAAKAKGQE